MSESNEHSHSDHRHLPSGLHSTSLYHHHGDRAPAPHLSHVPNHSHSHVPHHHNDVHDGKQSNSPRSYKIVLKVGSSSLASANGKHPNLSGICALVEAICDLRAQGHQVVLVSSGAVAIGCQRMKLAEKPKDLVVKQAVAAIGQGHLMRLYDDLFSALDQPVAQLLLTRDNLNKEYHYRNALNALQQLLTMGVVPIVNENDTVAVEELRFGDNDTLSALVASLIQADALFLLTDVDALYTDDPRSHPEATPIHIVENMEELKINLGSAGSWGTGGMATKLQAARIATAAGVKTVIIQATQPSNILKILQGAQDVGTQFLPRERPIRGRKKWIAHGIRPEGTIILDDGASAAILNHSSLFAAGIVAVEGDFHAHSAVVIKNSEGRELARGLTNYGSHELDLIKGKSSKLFHEILGYSSNDEVISRDNLAVSS